MSSYLALTGDFNEGALAALPELPLVCLSVSNLLLLRGRVKGREDAVGAAVGCGNPRRGLGGRVLPAGPVGEQRGSRPRAEGRVGLAGSGQLRFG